MPNKALKKSGNSKTITHCPSSNWMQRQVEICRYFYVCNAEVFWETKAFGFWGSMVAS